MMPAITDARRHFPEARLGWVVEEAYAPLAALHAAVDRVLPIALRRWRRNLLAPAQWREILAFVRDLRAIRYDAIIDSQGLIRSAMVADLCRGRRHGYDRASVRERPAVRFYDVRHAVARQIHAIERNRLLTGAALGYRPAEPLDYGLVAARPRPNRDAPYAVLLHASSAAEKLWPESGWVEIGGRLHAAGIATVLPSGTADELARSLRIGERIPQARAPETLPLTQMVELIGAASVVVGVDTGLLHLAAALGVPLVGIFTASEPGLTGPRGNGPIAIVGANGSAPPVTDVAAAVDRVLALAEG
jgi:heptosyltransferase-1